MLPVKRVIASATRSCQPFVLSSNCLRSIRARMLRSTTFAIAGSGSGIFICGPRSMNAAPAKSIGRCRPQAAPIIVPIGGAPAILVALGAAEEVELDGTLADGLLDRMTHDQHPGTESTEL